MFDLEVYLKGREPGLAEKYDEIQKECRKLWKDIKLPWFTDHTPSHSARLVDILNKILAPLENTDYILTPSECFVLLASCYLHDLGMQDLRVDDIPVDKLTESEYERIRKEHAQRSYEIIRQAVTRENSATSINLGIEGLEEWGRALMWVCKAHSTHYFDGVIQQIQDDQIVVRNKELRGEFLCALLMLADELDLPSARADFGDTKLITLSAKSKLHWFTHYYISKVDVVKQDVYIKYRVPARFMPDVDLLQKRVENKLYEQIARCNPIFQNATDGRLKIGVINSKAQEDTESLMEKMPQDVLELLKKEMSNAPTAGEISELTETAYHTYESPSPSFLFTGREKELEMLEGMLKDYPVSMITGIGGTGKTELVAKYIAKQDDDKQSSVFWFDLAYNHTSDDIAIALGKQEMLKVEKMTPREKGVNLAYAIEQSGSIIIIDNIQDIADDALAALLKHAIEHLKTARILLIGKAKPDMIVGLEPKLIVNEIHGLKEKGIEYAGKLKDLWHIDISADEMSSICADLQNHPLALEVAFKILKYGESPDNLIHKIVSFTHGNESQEVLSKRLLSELHGHATPEQRELAFKLSVFRKPFSRNATHYIAEVDSWESDFNILIDWLMLHSESKRMFSMHPLVKAFCYEELSNKAVAHAGAAEYYKSLRQNTADILLETEVIYHLLKTGKREEAFQILLDEGDNFLRWGHGTLLLEMLSQVAHDDNLPDKLLILRGRVLHYQSKYDLACKDFNKAGNSNNIEIKAEAKYRLALIAYIQGNLYIADLLHKESLSLAEQTGAEYLVAYNTGGLANIAVIKDQLNDAFKLHTQAYNILQKIGNVKQSDLATAIFNIGNALERQEQLTLALKNYQLSLNICKKIDYKTGIAFNLTNIGEVLQKQGHLSQALKQCQQGLKINEEIGYRCGIAYALNSISNIMCKFRKIDEAESYSLCACNIYKEIGAWSSCAISTRNLGTLYGKMGLTEKAIKNLLYAEALYKKLGIDNEASKTHEHIDNVMKAVGYKQFCIIAKAAYEQLEDDLKPYSGYEEFIKDQTIRRENPKVGPNAPCTCGSGKKYKKCCGKNS